MKEENKDYRQGYVDGLKRAANELKELIADPATRVLISNFGKRLDGLANEKQKELIAETIQKGLK